jgi:hypothetical protein
MRFRCKRPDSGGLPSPPLRFEALKRASTRQHQISVAADRTTSFAKSIEGLVHPESALDRARRLKDQFVRAQNDNQPPKQRETEKPPVGSQMVKDDMPVLRPTPNGPLRQPDRQAAYGRLSQERAEANKNLAAARRAHEAFRTKQGQHKTHDNDRDRER